MTLEQAIEELDKIQSGDAEMAHGAADDILLEFLKTNGYVRLTDAWLDVDGRVGGFWYA